MVYKFKQKKRLFPCPRHEGESFLTSVLDGGERLTSRSGRFTPKKENSVSLGKEAG